MSVFADQDREALRDHVAAELTRAAYPVVLRLGVGPKWLELELELWKTLTETVERLEQTAGQHTVPNRTSGLFG